MTSLTDRQHEVLERSKARIETLGDRIARRLAYLSEDDDTPDELSAEDAPDDDLADEEDSE